jgi:GNAT superfamily N-acetyltransferase
MTNPHSVGEFDMKDILVREALTDDTDDLARLLLAFRNEHSQMIGGKGSFTLDQATEEVQGNLRRQDSGYFAALDSSSNRLVGFRRWELHDGFYFTGELYVIPGMRRQGVAKELVRYFEQWVRSKGQDTACISCAPQNVAMMTLARSEGYEILNTIEMRKALTDDAREPRGETKAVGLKWRVL